jgi:hypothetical protein
MTTSIVISTFNRNVQLAQTLTSIARQQVPDLEVIVVDDGDLRHGHPSASLVCQTFGARYLPCRRPASSQFRNPSLPNNIGIRAATGDVVILQNAECRHDSPDAIQQLVSQVTATNAVFAHVTALNPDGSFAMDYCSPSAPRPYFFCGAIRREWLVRLRGFDQDYWGAGYDDDDLALRLHCEGVTFTYSDIKVAHQWHSPAGDYSSAEQMRQLFEEKCQAMVSGKLGTVRNPQGWGGQP